MRLLIKLVSLTIYVLATIANASTDMDVEAGKRIYTQCTGCHAPDYNRTGPMHCGLIGRAAGGVKNFEYTKAMMDSDIVWTRETLDKFLKSPFRMIPGTSMGFTGVSSELERRQLIEYLSQLDENNPICNLINP